MLTVYRLFRAGFHGLLLFFLPWIVGAIVGMAFDIKQVTETSGSFVSLFTIIVVPLLLLQLVAIAVKIGRDLRARRADGQRGFSVFVDAVDRHVRVLTGRGLGMVAASLIMIFFVLSVKWAELSVIAVAGLAIMYLASTIATLVSAFAVRAFDDRVRRGRGAIDREMSPTVVEAGDAVEERFFLARVPVPWGFRLHIEEELPERLGGDTRFALDRSVSRAEVTVSAPLPRTPRGVYKLGPADIWFEDVLGLTRVYVAAKASASLRSLPRLRPLVFERRPRSTSKSEGPLSVLARIATEEHFKTRQYVPGDDLRRVHWKQSINTGQLMVRVPEAIPFAPTRVRLVLDTFLPPGWRISPTAGGRKERADEKGRARAPDVMDDVLDLLVESWIGLAHTLLRRGEKVSLVAAVRENGVTVVRDIECKRGEERKWRAIGSDAAWQHELDVARTLASIKAPPGAPTSSIVVSAGLFFYAEGRPPPGTSFVIGDGASVVYAPPPDDWGVLRRFFVSDFPVGSEDNKVDLRKLFSPAPPEPTRIQAELARTTAFAIDHARTAGAGVVVARRTGLSITLSTP